MEQNMEPQGPFGNPQTPDMPKMIDNVTLRVKDDLEETVTKKSKLRIAAACFSIYAYEELILKFN